LLPFVKVLLSGTSGGKLFIGWSLECINLTYGVATISILVLPKQQSKPTRFWQIF
jgi:hypothetical protein